MLVGLGAGLYGQEMPTPALNTPYAWRGPTASATDDILQPVSTTLVEDFEDRDLTGWWGFGELLFSVVENSAGQYEPTIQGRSVRLEGQANDRYIGGCGRVLGLDSSRFNAIKLLIKGNLPRKSGTLIVELYPSQDDAWLKESEERRRWFLKYEHRYTYTLEINWKGWRLVTIPFKAFLKDGARVRHLLYNPSTNTGAGTLIQLQFLILSGTKKGRADFQVDSISFIKDPNIQSVPGLLDY